MLINRGAYVDARNDNKQTPLYLAVKHNKNPAVIEMLISRGADVNARDNHGWPPSRRYENREDEEVIEMLRRAANDKTRYVAPSGHPCVLSMLWSFFRQ